MVLAQKQTWRAVEPNMNPCNYAHLTFDKVAKNIWWRKDCLFNKCHWEKWLSSCRRLNLDPCLSPSTSINSKWIKYLNIIPETFKIVHERAGYTLEAVCIAKDFLSRTQVAQQWRERIDKWDYVKLKSFLQQKK
jgi:hypothetical protein